MSEVENVLLSELIQWYSLQRHDFMNHWQVIMGNLQLNMPERALAYIKEIVLDCEQEQKAGYIPQPKLAAILLGLIIQLKREGIIATIDFPEVMKQELFWREHWREEYAQAIYGYTRECLEISLSVAEPLKNLIAEVYLYDEPGGLSCQFILTDEEDVLLDKAAKFF